MGQIVFNEQKPKYANLLAIKTGSKKDYPIPANEVWLIDSTNATKSNGKGKYDKYIVGDGQTAAKNLPLLDIDPDVPTHLSQLIADENHKTVKEEDIQRWNNGTGGGGTPVASSEDITVINDSQESVNRLQFANKTHDSSEYSGLGKVYLRKNIQEVPVKESENLFNAFSATAIYNDAYNIAYNTKYKELIEAGTYDADGKTAANAAYTTAYNDAITAGKTTPEATNLGNAAYVKAYKDTIKGDEDAEAAVVSVNTTSDNTGKTSGNTAWETEYPNIAAWNRQYYIDGRFTTVGNNKYINITPQYRFSLTSCRINVHAGEVYKIFGKKTDSAGGVQWISRFWMITETPAAGATQAKVLQAYKIDNEDYSEQQANETVFVEVEHDGVLWINYNTYSAAAGQCKVERIYNTAQTEEANCIYGITESNTEYIIQYDYDLSGNVLQMPDNCVLKFEGGSITNGIIQGKHTTIIAPHSAKILTGTLLIGTWTNVDYYPKWFGAVADGVTDDTDILQTMLDISSNINSDVHLQWYGYTFRTTKQLYLKSHTIINGGTINAKFENQMAWVLKTYNYVATADKVYGDSAPGALVSWQEHDGGYAQRVDGSHIYDLTIKGELNEHLTNGEPDGTYTPIFGGLCLMASDACTNNVRISGVGVAIGRGASLWTYDCRLNAKGLFVGFAGYAINGHSIRDSYINAYCTTEGDTSSKTVTPYYPEYQTLTTLPKSGYVYNDGGIDMVEGNPQRPFFCNVQLVYNFSMIMDGVNVLEMAEPSEDDETAVIIDNPLIDGYSEVGFCVAAHSNLTVRHAWFEQVHKCLVYLTDSKVNIDTPFVDSKNDYDIVAGGTTSNIITLKGCGGEDGIMCAGGTTETYKKYNITNLTRVNVLDARISPYPVNDDRFYFLTSGSASGLPVSVIPSSGTGSLTNNTLNAASGTYYRFNYTVNTLIINLPDMTGVSSVRPVILYVETGENPNISFTSPDNKTITQYSNYEINMNSKYEINCLYNGTKWIVAAAVID